MKNFRKMIEASEFIKATNGLIEFSKKQEQELTQLRAENARLTAEVEAAEIYIVDLTHPLNAILPMSNSREAYWQARAARLTAKE